MWEVKSTEIEARKTNLDGPKVDSLKIACLPLIYKLLFLPPTR